MTMLRSVLRNVQYYLLFFSILLVLLAFQRLQWYDQGLLPNPYAFIDRPMHGRGFTSPDSAGRVYYGGDESKEIGLFKFRLGLFNFALPTFSKDNAAWERSMTVPPPPSKRRKNAENLYSRLKAQSRLHSKSSEERGKSEKERILNSSVAYFVVIPQLKRPYKFQRTSSIKNANEDEVPLERSFHNRSKVLSQSIGRAHTNSPYEYQLYALIFNGESSNDDGWGQEELIQSGFKIVNVSDGELGDVGKEMTVQSDRKLRRFDEQQPSLLKLLNQHDIIVHISLSSFLLKPMNDLFDVLLEGGNTNKVTGVVDVERGSTADEKSDGKSKRDESNTTQVDLFALELLDAPSATSPIEQNELIIFRSGSQDATNAYLKSLQCARLDLFQPKQSKQMIFYPKLRPTIVARKARGVEHNPKQYTSNKAECAMLTESSLRLDRCLYDAGNFDIGHDCSHVSFKNDARVSRFPQGRGAAVGTAGLLRAANNTAKTNIHSYCAKPWEFSSDDDCSKSGTNHEKEEICTWLCSKWFSFVK